MEDDGKPSARADFLSALVWIGLGLGIVYLSWTMDRLAHLNVSPYTVPGLVPGILGGAIALMGAILLLRAWRQGLGGGKPLFAVAWAEQWRLGVCAGLSILYTLAVLKSALPFWLVTAVFVAAFVLVFQYAERRAAGQVPRGIAIALVHGLISGLAIQYVFEDLFLVRLP